MVRIEACGWRPDARRLDSTDCTAYVAAMLRIVSPRSMGDERPPVGAAVRLRVDPDVTGVVVGDTFEFDRVRVRWDDTERVTDCIAAKLEPAK